jgi:hypothetical protein
MGIRMGGLPVKWRPSLVDGALMHGDSVTRKPCSTTPAAPRTREQFARFFTGLDLVEPGIVPVVDWRPDDDPATRPSPAEAAVYAGVARIP